MNNIAYTILFFPRLARSMISEQGNYDPQMVSFIGNLTAKVAILAVSSFVVVSLINKYTPSYEDRDQQGSVPMAKIVKDAAVDSLNLIGIFLITTVAVNTLFLTSIPISRQLKRIFEFVGV